MLWENRSFISRVKLAGNQLICKLRLIFKIIFAANKVILRRVIANLDI
jgi:hypothetical protein